MSVPVWVMAAVALAVIAGLFVWFSIGLNAASDELFARMQRCRRSRNAADRAAPRRCGRRPPPPEPARRTRSVTFLKPEIEQGLVTVDWQAAPSRSCASRNRGMFASGSATSTRASCRLLDRIGEALKAEPGTVEVIGYTDNQPIHTVQFPSNFQLSAARAEAARAIIVRALGDPGAARARRGAANADPMAPNATPEGREQNRRIEVVLHRQGCRP